MSKSSKTGLYLIAGALLGIGVGYLLFKEKGGEEDSDGKSVLRDKFDSIKKKIEDKLAKTSDKIEDVIDELIDQADIATPDLIEYLETKVKSLKDLKPASNGKK